MDPVSPAELLSTPFQLYNFQGVSQRLLVSLLTSIEPLMINSNPSIQGLVILIPELT